MASTSETAMKRASTLSEHLPRLPLSFLPLAELRETPARSSLRDSMTGAQLQELSRILEKTVVQEHRALVITEENQTQITKHKSKLFPEASGHWIDSPQATKLFAVIILVNIVVIGVQADLPIPESDFQDTAFLTWFIIESLFNLAFVTEIVLHLRVDGAKYFFQIAHFFDIGIVVLSVIDTWVIGLIVAAMPGTSFRFVSAFRVLRLLRVLRIFRLLEFCKTLWVVINTLIGALTALRWIMVLIILFLYMVAVTLRLTIGVTMHSKLDGEALDTAKQRWGNVAQSMFTLFVCMTGEAWYDIALDAVAFEPWSYLVFVPFMVIANLLLVNLFVGVMCEKVSAESKNTAREREQKADEETVEELAEIFVHIDLDGSETITVKELSTALESAEFQQRFDGLHVSLSNNANALMRFFDTSLDGQIGFEEFVNGCMALRNSTLETKIWFLQDELRQYSQRILNAVDPRGLTDTPANKGRATDFDKGRARLMGKDRPGVQTISGLAKTQVTGPTADVAVAVTQVLESRLSEIKKSLTEDLIGILETAALYEAKKQLHVLPKVQSPFSTATQEARSEPIADPSKQPPADPQATESSKYHKAAAEAKVVDSPRSRQLKFEAQAEIKRTIEMADEAWVAAPWGEETLTASAIITAAPSAPPKDVEVLDCTEITSPSNAQSKLKRPTKTAARKTEAGAKKTQKPRKAGTNIRTTDLDCLAERTAIPDGQAECPELANQRREDGIIMTEQCFEAVAGTERQDTRPDAAVTYLARVETQAARKVQVEDPRAEDYYPPKAGQERQAPLADRRITSHRCGELIPAGE